MRPNFSVFINRLTKKKKNAIVKDKNQVTTLCVPYTSNSRTHKHIYILIYMYMYQVYRKIVTRGVMVFSSRRLFNNIYYTIIQRRCKGELIKILDRIKRRSRRALLLLLLFFFFFAKTVINIICAVYNIFSGKMFRFFFLSVPGPLSENFSRPKQIESRYYSTQQYNITTIIY